MLHYRRRRTAGSNRQVTRGPGVISAQPATSMLLLGVTSAAPVRASPTPTVLFNVLYHHSLVQPGLRLAGTTGAPLVQHSLVQCRTCRARRPSSWCTCCSVCLAMAGPARGCKLHLLCTPTSTCRSHLQRMAGRKVHGSKVRAAVSRRTRSSVCASSSLL